MEKLKIEEMNYLNLTNMEKLYKNIKKELN